MILCNWRDAWGVYYLCSNQRQSLLNDNTPNMAMKRKFPIHAFNAMVKCIFPKHLFQKKMVFVAIQNKNCKRKKKSFLRLYGIIDVYIYTHSLDFHFTGENRIKNELTVLRFHIAWFFNVRRIIVEFGAIHSSNSNSIFFQFNQKKSNCKFVSKRIDLSQPDDNCTILVMFWVTLSK